MNCWRVQHLLSAYIDSELTGTEMIAVRHHIDSCEACKREYASILAVKKCLGLMATKRPVSKDLANKICSRVSYERSNQHAYRDAPSFVIALSMICKFKYYAISAAIIVLFLVMGANSLNANRRANMLDFTASADAYINMDQLVNMDIGEALYGSASSMNNRFNPVAEYLGRKNANHSGFDSSAQMLLASYR